MNVLEGLKEKCLGRLFHPGLGDAQMLKTDCFGEELLSSQFPSHLELFYELTHTQFIFGLV